MRPKQTKMLNREIFRDLLPQSIFRLVCVYCEIPHGKFELRHYFLLSSALHVAHFRLLIVRLISFLKQPELCWFRCGWFSYSSHCVLIESFCWLRPCGRRTPAAQYHKVCAYQADGQVQKAIILIGHVVSVKARTLRDDHPSRLVSVEPLADMYAELAVDSDKASSLSRESSTLP